MAKAAPHECTRCGGTGMTTHIRAHYGVPGLCFDCNGDGKRETQVRTIQAAKREKQIRELAAMADAEIWRSGTEASASTSRGTSAAPSLPSKCSPPLSMRRSSV